MTNAPFASIEELRDIESVNHYRHATGLGEQPADVLASLRAMGRDNARTPMQWDASPHAGFTSGTPWLAVHPDHATVNAEAALADPDSVFHHYRRLIALRKSEPAVALGDFTMLLPDDPVVYAFTRRLDDVELLCVANFSGAPARPEVPGWDDWLGADLLIGNVAASTGPVLEAWEARVLRRRTVPPEAV